MIVQLLNALAMNAGHETGSGRRKMAGRSLDSRMTHEQSNLKKRWKGAALVCFLFFAVWLAFPAPGTSQETSEKAPVTKQQANPDAGQSSKADDTDKKAGADHVLDEMVVTATRTATPLSQVPASVSVVTKADLDKRNVQSVNSAVDFVPGLFDKQAKPLDTTSRVIIRGIPDQKRNLVLLDGLPINDAYTGVTNWNGMLPENLERIEVARGPFSSLYGGNAMGGVVNLFTRMPEKREFTIQGNSGSDSYMNAYASYGDKLFNRLSIFASYGYQGSNGYPTNLIVKTPSTPGQGTAVYGAEPTTTSQGKPAFIIGDAGDNSWYRQSGILKLAYDLTDNSRASFSYYRNQYGYGYEDPNNLLTTLNGGGFWSGSAIFEKKRFSVSESNFLPGEGAVTQNIYSAAYETGLFSNAFLKASCGFVDNTSNWYTSTSTGATQSGLGPGTINQTPSQAVIADLQLSVPILDKHMLIFGGGYRYDHANTEEYRLRSWQDTDSRSALTYESGGKDSIYSIYSQAEIALLEKLKAYVGLRGDWWHTYDGSVNQLGEVGVPTGYPSRGTFNLSPKGSLVYTPFEKTTLRGSIGTAFRPPNVYELFRTWSSSTTNTIYESNPNLDPETSFSWDVGVEQRIGNAAVIKASYFFNRLYDMIYQPTITADDVSPIVKRYLNAAEAQTDGVELDWDHRVVKWFRYFANFTYTHSRMVDFPLFPDTVGKQLVGVPEYMFSLGTEFSYGPASLMLTGRYASKQYNDAENLDKTNAVYGSYDPYFVADLSIKYSMTKNAILSFAINNLFDEDYFSYYQAPGRKFYGGLTLKF